MTLKNYIKMLCCACIIAFAIPGLASAEAITEAPADIYASLTEEEKANEIELCLKLDNIKNDREDALKMLEEVNKFRTGSEAYYNGKNGQTVYVNGLKGLEWDEGLTYVAYLRALEISVRFDHINSTDENVSAKLKSFGISSYGENLAGSDCNDFSSHQAMNGLKENGYSYSGQGHRRNMLNSNWTHVGIAVVRLDTMTCIVQIFSTTSTRTPAYELINYPDDPPSYPNAKGYVAVNANNIISLNGRTDNWPTSFYLRKTVDIGESVNMLSILTDMKNEESDEWTINGISQIAKYHDYPWYLSNKRNITIGIAAWRDSFKHCVNGGNYISNTCMWTPTSYDDSIIIKSKCWGIDIEITVNKGSKCKDHLDNNNDDVCDICKASCDVHQHVWLIRLTQNATCSKTGIEGNQECVLCGESKYPDKVIPKNPDRHTSTKYTERVNPTCTETGLSSECYCGGCGYVFYKAEVLPALGHSPVGVEKQAATCTATGLTAGTKCSRCKTILSGCETIPMTAHTPVVKNKITACCTDKGYTGDSYCSTCNKLLQKGKETAIDPNCHCSVKKVYGEAATCVTDGVEESEYCTACKKTIKGGAVIPATGHNYKITYHIDATAGHEGETEYECENCYDTYTVTTPKKSLAKTVITSTKWTYDNDEEKVVLTVTWDKDQNAEYYEVRYGTTDKVSDMEMWSYYHTNTKDTIYGFDDSKTYYVRVRAWAEGLHGEKTYGKWSDAARVVCPPRSPECSIVSRTATGMKIEIDPRLFVTDYKFDIGGYLIQQKTGDGKWTTITPKITNEFIVGHPYSSYFTPSGLKTGTKYSYRVKTYLIDDETGKKIYSVQYSDTVSFTAIQSPSDVEIKNVSTGLRLSWSQVTGSDGYYVYKYTTANGKSTWKKIATLKSGTTTYLDKDVTNGKLTKYRVYTYVGNKKSVAAAASTYRLKTPVPTLKSTEKGKVKVTWSKNSAATGYQIRYSLKSDMSNSKTVSTTGTSKTLSLTAGKTYYIQIRVYYKNTSNNKTYYSAWSSTKNIKVSK